MKSSDVHGREEASPDGVSRWRDNGRNLFLSGLETPLFVVTFDTAYRTGGYYSSL